MIHAAQKRALQCARHYRKLGLVPLPSRMDEKAPLLPSYAQYWEEAVPDHIYDEDRWRTTNIQLMTGTKTAGATKIFVVDCDGAEGFEAWRRICDFHKYTPTSPWVSVTGSGGHHFYYRVPAGLASCPSGMIWGVWDTFGDNGNGKWLKHQEVRILGDNALNVAPPSLHVKTGEPYYFDSGYNPKRFRLPEVAPPWLLEMPRLVAPRCSEPPKVLPAARPPWRPSGTFYRREEVLAAIPDKIALAASWGLVMPSRRPNLNGWVTAFVPGREDPRHSHPSGSLHHIDGTFQDRKDLHSISLFDLGVLLGRFSTWQECRDHCGDQYLGRLRVSAAG